MSGERAESAVAASTSAPQDEAVDNQPQVPAVDSQAQLSAEALMEQLRDQFEQLCQGVASAVNQAPPGQVINASEEKVRDLLAVFRATTYQTAVQLRLEAQEAAFPPSGASRHRQTSAEQGP